MKTAHSPERYSAAMTERLLTQADVADVLRISRWTVARLIARGELSGVRVGDRLRFRARDIDAYLERGTP